MFEFQKKKTKTIILIIIFFGIALRFYEINNQNYWWDEMLGFWTADPKVTFDETFSRHTNHDYSSIIFHLIMKLYYNLVSYNPEFGRYITATFGCLSIFFIGILSIQINKNYKPLILTLIFCSLNSYLISYSQEVRLYSLIFLTSIINIIFFFRIILEKKKGIFDYLILSIINFICLFLSPFLVAITISQIIYCFLEILLYKKNHKKILIFIFLSLILFIGFNSSYIIALSKINVMNYYEPNLNFVRNLFFPDFFGSKIMGLIFFITLILCILFNIKKIFVKNSKYLFFILLILMSYSIPIVFYFLGNPLFHNRYIIFILISLIILISHLIFEIRYSKLRIFLILLPALSSLIHSIYYISTIDKSTKPEFNKIFIDINKSKVKQFVFNYDENKVVSFKENSEVKLDNATISILENYIKASKDYKKYNLHLKNIKNIKDHKQIWVLCYEPLSLEKCDITTGVKKNYTISNKKEYNLIKATLISFN